MVFYLDGAICKGSERDEVAVTLACLVDCVG